MSSSEQQAAAPPTGVPPAAAGNPYPPYVITDEDRRRWDICLSTARALSELCEPAGVADNTFVWYETRALYKSDMPTGEPADQAV